MAAFVGISGAYHAADDDVYGWHSAEHPGQIGTNVDRSCAPSGAWDAIQTSAQEDDPDYNPVDPPKYLVNQCANASYVDNLLYSSDGLFTGKQKNKLKRMAPSGVTVKGQQRTVLTWTRGYLLLKYGNKCADCGKPGTSEYRAVIDAGSSGTRLSFYRVKYKPSGYPHVSWRLTLKGDSAENGIDDYVNPILGQRPGTGNVNADVIDPLIDQLASGYLKNHPPTPGTSIKVDLLATAGMREAQAKWGKRAVNRTYRSIRANLNNTAAPFNTSLQSASHRSSFGAGLVQTINGSTQEGVWTWVNLNDYYCNYFKAPKGSKKPVCRGAKGGFLGVVEVGGASTQISFPVAAREATPRENIHQVTLHGRNLRVFNKTYLGLGSDSARRTMALAVGAQLS